VWLICQAALGRGKNKRLVRGIQGAEWVFCPLIKSVKNGRIGTDRCQRCKHFVRFEQTYIPQAQTTPALRGTFDIRRPLGRLGVTHPHATPFPHIPSLIKERQPLIDIFEEEDHIKVLAELPGVEEKDVNIITDEKTIMITAENATKKYLKIVRLPTCIKKSKIKSTYRNNILQISLEKLRATEHD